WRQSVIGSHIYGNKAAIGPAGFLGGFSYACITGNSIHDNEATTSGVLHIERTGAKSFATLANNTIANNTSAGAGSALETLQPVNSTIAIVNNTIVGNRSKVSNGSAVYVKDATTANVYSNIIAGNKGGDIAFGNTNTAVKDVCNIFSDEDCATKLDIMLDGHVDGDEFIPTVNEQGVIAVKLPYYGDCGINDVTAQMLDEKTFMGDVDNNAEMIQHLTTDQTGKTRRTDGTSTRGAVEAETGTPWDGTAVCEPTIIKTGTFKGFYLITKPEHLAWVSTMTEAAAFDGNLYIAADIDLGNHSWKPIGAKNPFRGSIEGNNRLISGINITATEGETAALIAQVDNASARINNLRLSGKIKADGATAVGSLIGKATALESITSVHSAVDIEIEDGANCTTGCIVGEAKGSTIAGCSYSGQTTINGKTVTGSFIDCNITSAYSSGNVEGSIEKCIAITPTLTFQVGSNGITDEHLHNGELTRRLNDGNSLGYFGQDMSKRNSVPVTRTEMNTVYQTQYIVGDTLYHQSYNNHTLIFPSDPKVEGFIFRGWIDANGNRMTSSSFINSDTIITASLEPLEKWDGTSAAEPMKIDNADSPYYGWYQINKPAELAWVAQKTKAAAFDGNLYIANDIDLDNHTWSPIGYNYNFNGSIEGNGYTIRNISMHPGASVKCYGFIGQTNNAQATISNLNITGSMIIETSSKSANVGGLIGKANSMATITNCHSNINITMKKGSLVSYLGGIVGLIKNTDIVSSSYSGTMALEGGQVAKGWGGLVGTFNSTVEGDEGGLRYSWFCGKIISTTTVKPTYGAALVGYPSLSGGSCKIENCYACGVFSATTKPTNFGVIYAKKGTGTTTANNYSVGLTGNTDDGAINATEDQLHNGELCWLLNRRQTESNQALLELPRCEPMEQREQKANLLALCRVVTEEDGSQGGKAAKQINGGETDAPYFYQNIDNGMELDSIPLADTTHGIVYKLANGTYSNLADDPQGIEEVHNSQCKIHNAQFNIQGIRVRKNYKGIVITGGKKYLVK
ncbi:MAG: right-handed parallel beta-helix repeat-containing protein, partial [Prevotellaceae bacterium]|nr:right-handed parallel beta-helix repeat-containing protein [Prevotellaceae bacterium]